MTSGGSLPGNRPDRSFEPVQPGQTASQGEGGGSMSGRGQESPGEPRSGDPQAAGSSAADASSTGEGVAQGLATPLQPGGMMPGGGPGASQGSLGTGGGSTADAQTGSLKRGGV